MTGTFNSTIQAQIAGQSTAPLIGQTMLNTAPTNQASATASHSTSNSVTASSALGAASTASTLSAASTSSNSAALNSKVGWMAIILGSLTGVTTL